MLLFLHLRSLKLISRRIVIICFECRSTLSISFCKSSAKYFSQKIANSWDCFKRKEKWGNLTFFCSLYLLPNMKMQVICSRKLINNKFLRIKICWMLFRYYTTWKKRNSVLRNRGWEKTNTRKYSAELCSCSKLVISRRMKINFWLMSLAVPKEFRMITNNIKFWIPIQMKMIATMPAWLIQTLVWFNNLQTSWSFWNDHQVIIKNQSKKQNYSPERYQWCLKN